MCRHLTNGPPRYHWLVRPGAASRWINAYARDPLHFVLSAGLVALLLWLSAGLKERITDQMRSAWRVSLGGLYQTFPSLGEALVFASRSSAWKLADLAQLDPDKSYYVEFNYRLDTSQLPGPMQFGLGGQGDWAVGASRTLKVDLGAP